MLTPLKSLFSKERIAAPKGAPLDARRLLAPVGLGLLLGAGACSCFKPLRLTPPSKWPGSGADRITTQARQTLGGFVSERQRTLGEALVHPEIERYFGSGAAGDPVRALAAIRERMSEVEGAPFINADVLSAIGNDIAGFGYANAEMLLNAARMGAPAPAQVHGRAGKRELVLVNPVTVGGTIVGFVLAKLPYAPLKAAYDDLPTGGLKLCLLQGGSGQTTEAIEGLGESGLSTAAIPGSMLRLGYRVPAPLIVAGPTSAFGNLIAALISLLTCALIVLWRRQPDLLERLLRRQDGGAMAHETVTQRADAQIAKGRGGQRVQGGREESRC